MSANDVPVPPFPPVPPPEHSDPALPDWIAELLERLTVGLETSDGDGCGTVAYRYDDWDELYECPLLLVEPTLAEITGGGALDGTVLRFDIQSIDLLILQQAFTRVAEVRYHGNDEDEAFGSGPYLEFLGEVADARVRVIILLMLQSVASDEESIEEGVVADGAADVALTEGETEAQEIDDGDDADELDEASAEDEPWSDTDGESWRRRG